MKRFVKYVVSFVLAGLIFYGGSGVSLMLCHCDKCALFEKSCCSPSKGSGALNCCEMDMATCFGDVKGAKCCDFERVDFLWDHAPHQFIQMKPASFDLFYFASGLFFLPSELYHFNYSCFTDSGPPPHTTPRDYLSALTVLII